MNTSPMVGCQSRQVNITADSMTSYGLMTSSGGIGLNGGRPLSMGSPPTGLVQSLQTWMEGMGAYCQTVMASSPGVEWWVHLSLWWQ